MGKHVGAVVGSPRRWLSIAVGVVAGAALAGCSAVQPAANNRPPTPSSSQLTAIAVPSPSDAVRMPPATASMPAATGTKSHAATLSPSATGAGGTARGGSPTPAPGSGSGPSGSGSGSTGSASCVTSAQQDSCGPYNYPQIQGAAAEPGITNDIWNPISGWQQTLYADSPGNWHVVVTGPSGNTAVVSYPDVQTLFGDKALSSFHALYSSFSENMHVQSGTSGEAAYDVFLNNWSNEVMFMHDMHNIGSDPQYAIATFGGSHGVPAQQWRLVHNGGELIWMLNGAAEQTGSVDILAMLNWTVSHGYLPAHNTLTDIDYGFEVCSTGGRPETLTVSGYSLTAS